MVNKFMHVDAIAVVRALGTALCLAGIVLCWQVRRKRFAGLPADKPVSLGMAVVMALAVWKLRAFAGLVVVPAATVAVANYHTFRGVHEVQACGRCHVMQPMITDLYDPDSDTLAARHFKNRWIPQDQCYACHSDYGLGGDLEAKMTGFRHLMRYTTHTYTEPIQARTPFNNDNCLKCHGEAPRFRAVASHQTAHEQLAASTMSCLNCHGQAHPTRAARTPGSPEYEWLMGGKR
jgi:hypothetical protein